MIASHNGTAPDPGRHNRPTLIEIATGWRMADTKRKNSLLNGRFLFLQEFLKHPLQIGSIIPSSGFLEQRILDVAGIKSAKTIVELGSGTGGTTRAILGTMAHNARLLSIEINPRFHAMVKAIEDDRLIAHLGSASELGKIISAHGLDAPDVIISGIPFSTLDNAEGCRVIEAVSSLLAPSGRFVAYQVSKRVATLCRPVLGPERMRLELLNIPPMRVYQWEKQGA
jgi:phosphatidylethanolamine/phosphatidyl-N-methylethanolamine N-methyltransferase